MYQIVLDIVLAMDGVINQVNKKKDKCKIYEITKFKYEFISSIIFTNLISHKIPNLNRTTGRTWCYLSALITFFFLIATRIFKYKN